MTAAPTMSACMYINVSRWRECVKLKEEELHDENSESFCTRCRELGLRSADGETALGESDVSFSEENLLNIISINKHTCLMFG